MVPAIMSLRCKHFALIGCVLAAPYLLTAQDSDHTPAPAVMQAVEAVFPQELRYKEPPLPGAESSPDYHKTCAEVFSRNADGTPSLIAAAYNGDGAEIAMLSYQSGAAKIISAITNQRFSLWQGECDMQIVNLADPQISDSPLARTIDATFHGGPDWFFIWDGQKFENITWLQKQMDAWHGKRVPASDMYSAQVVDIDHTGLMQIIGDSGGEDRFPDSDGIASTGTALLFRYNGTTYAPEKTLLCLREFEPNLPKTSDQQAGYKWGTTRWVQKINMHQSPVPSYQLRIINGDRNGANRVTSAKVEVNGVAIVSSAEMNQSVETLTRTIHLKKQNKIKVTVEGSADSHLYLTVE